MRMLLGAAFIALLFTPALAGDSWSTFRDPGGVFAVDMPGTPTVSADKTKAGDGSDVPILSYVIDRGTSAMIVMVGDFTGFTVDPGKAIDNGVASILASKTAQSNKIDQLDGQVGRNLLFADAENQYTDRIFFVNNKLYQVLTVVPRSGDAAEKTVAARFSASFHFTFK